MAQRVIPQPPLPLVVRLVFDGTLRDETGRQIMAVSALDQSTDITAFSGSLDSVAGWLDRNRYTYIKGSNALWVRLEDAGRRQP